MKTMKLGKTGIDISRIGLGTWSIGGGSAWGGDHELQTVVDTIREAPKAGVNLIDTAPINRCTVFPQGRRYLVYGKPQINTSIFDSVSYTHPTTPLSVFIKHYTP